MRQDGNVYYVNFYRSRAKNYNYALSYAIVGIATAGLLYAHMDANNRGRMNGLERRIIRSHKQIEEKD